MGNKEKTGKEKLADLCFNLSNTSFGVAVLGALATFTMDLVNKSAADVVLLLIFGCVLTIGFAYAGYKLTNE